MTTILQITDTHIVRDGALVSDRLDTAAALARSIDRIQSVRNQIGAIDVVLISGDLSDDGSAQSYERFKTLLAPLDLPLLVILGNHDVRAPMRAAFAGQFKQDGPLDWVTQVGDLRIIGLDTLVEKSGKGTLCAQSLVFLKTALAEGNDTPTLLSLHHPPFRSVINFMDNIGLTIRAAFSDVVSDHTGPLRIVCGHIHSMIVTDVEGHIAISAPSPWSTFAYNRRIDATVGFMALEDGCLLHTWDGAFQTIRFGPDAGPGPFPF